MTAILESVPQEPAAPPPTGEVTCTFAPRSGRTIISSQYHRGALTLIRPLYLAGDDEATLTIVNPGGGYVGGDHYTQSFTLAPGAQAVLTTQSATRVYRTPRGAACQDVRLHIGAGAVATFVPHELIGYADARFTQRTTALVDPEGTLFARDIVTPGWSPDGQPFRYDRLRTVLDVLTPTGRRDRLDVRDNLVLQPGVHGLLEDDGPLGAGATHIGSLLACSPHAGDDCADIVRDVLADAGGTAVTCGVTTLSRPGVMIRALGASTGAIETALTAVIDHLRDRWFGRAPLARRTY